MRKQYAIGFLFWVAGLLSCGGFKLDSGRNCLNQESACFKWDDTDPKFVSASPDPIVQVTALPTITLVFSEELENGTDLNAYKLTKPNGLSLRLVRKTAPNTYEVSLDGSIQSTGDITLDFSALKDYRGISKNFISGKTSVTYSGKVDSTITASTDHNGVGATVSGYGFTTLTATFQHDFATDPNNTWQIRVTSGIVDCNAGTQVLASGTMGFPQYLAANTQVVSTAIGYTNFVVGFNRLVICVQNQINQTVQPTWSKVIIRDDTAPVISSALPLSDVAASLDPFTVTCGDNSEAIAITSVGPQNTVPAAPTNPQFNTDGTIAVGSLYTGPIPITNSLGNPTYINYKWLCRDIAGHIQTGAIQARNYGVDTTLPPVNVTLTGTYHSAVSNTAGGYPNTTLQFTTDQVSPKQYKIIRGGTGCNDGAATTLVALTNLPATAFTTVSNSIPVANFPTPNGTIYDVRICVQHPIIAGSWGVYSLQITRDDVIPTYAGATNLFNPNDGTINLTWANATDIESGVEFYDICQTTTSGGCNNASFVANYSASGAATSYQVTGLNPATTYYFVVRARDYAGNRDANNVEKKSRIALSVTVAGYSSAVPDFRVTEGGSTLIFTSNGTQVFSNVYTAGSSYAISIVNQPGGQHCAFTQNQFGSIFSDTVLNVTCVTGSSLAKRLQPNTAAPLNYNLYRGNVTSLVAAGLLHPCEMTYSGGFLYYSDYTNENPPASGTCSGNNCRIVRVNASTGALTTITGTLSGVARGIATDGTNLYYTITGQTGVYKIPIGGGTQLTVATGFVTPTQILYSNYHIFVADSAGGGIKKINLTTGQVSLVATTTGNTGMEVVGSTLYFVTTSHTINSVPVSGGTPTVAFGSTGVQGFRDGTNALFDKPQDIVGDGVRNLYVTEYNNNVIRRIDLRNNRVTTISGRGITGAFTAGVGPAAIIQNPVGIASDGRNLYANLHNVHRTIKITDSGLAGYWPVDPGVTPFDYNSDGAAVNNGAVVGGALSAMTDRFGSAGLATRFNGSTQYISTGTGVPANMDQAMTLAAWVNINDLTTVSAIMGTGTFKFRFNVQTDGSLYFQNWYGGGASTKRLVSSSPGVVIPNQWVHVAYIFIPGAAIFTGGRVYVNGHDVTQSSSLVGSASDAMTVPLTIGYSTAAGFQNYLKGSIADARVYARALSEGELNELAQDASPASVGASYNSGATGLLSHYSFPGPSFLESRVDYGALNSTLSLSGTFAPVAGKDADTSAAANFDGTNYLNGSAMGLPSGASPRTHCAWVKPSDYPTIIYSIMRYGDSGAPGGCSDLLMQDNAGTPSLAFGSCGATAAEYTTVNYSLPLNTWSHVCGTLAAGYTVSIYVNGVNVVTTTGVTTNWQTNPAGMNLQVANFNGVGGYAYKGAVDDVRIYNSALSQFQIRQLATQVPTGLVARYDFTGDRNDVSGFGQNLNNNGASSDFDRFGVANASARFSGGSHLDGAMAYFPTGNQPRTICAWTNPSTLFNGTFSEAVMYGTSSAGWGFGMDAAGGLPNGRFFILDTAGDLAYAMPHGLSIWRHVCSTHDGATEQIYVDGNSIASATRTLATAPGSLFIGKGVFVGDFFNGNIDDVRIYNRALSTIEIRALQQQPAKRIYVTTNSYSGNLGGIPGADSNCMSDPGRPNASTYKALLVTIGTATRRACTGGGSCSSGVIQNSDWVMRPNLTYTRANGLTPIGTTNWGGVFDFGAGNLTYSIGTSAVNAWTGLITNWDADVSTANDWTNAGLSGVWGLASAVDGTMLYNGWGTGTLRLYCVEQ